MNGAAEFEAGKRIDRYRIVKTIGSGSSGTVYEAIDERLERPVAIKVADVADPLEEGGERTARFTREGRFAASLSHPNLCPVYDFGIHHGRPYLVMALLPGATLADLIARHAPLAADRIVVLLRPIAEALAEMHRVGLVHGDVKPQNILLDARLEPMLTDFGLARSERFVGRASGLGRASGGRASGGRAAAASPAYQAPEQLHAGPTSGAPYVAAPRIGPAADMHALGAILYVLLTGRLPFAGTPEETVQKILETTPAAPSSIATGVSRDLEQICLRLLRKNPAERPSAIEVARRLRLIADRGGAPLGRWSDSAETSNLQEHAGEASARQREPSDRGSDAGGDTELGRRGPSRSTVVALLALLLLPILGYALYTTAPWKRIATVLPPSFGPESQPAAESDTEVGSGPDGALAPGAERGDEVEERRAPAAGGAEEERSGAPRSETPPPISVEEFDPELAGPPARLFLDGGRVVVAAAALPAAAEGNAVAWWMADGSDSASDGAPDSGKSGSGAVTADSLVPVRQGGSIAGVMTSGSGETVAILGDSWYGRVAASGGSVATNPVSGWLTVERAATSPSGRFALLQKTGLENRKRISVWNVADGANPAALRAFYTDDSTTALALSPNGRGLAFGDQRGRVTMQQVSDEGKVLAELEVGGPVSSLAFAEDNLKLAVAHAAGENAAGENAAGGITRFEYNSAAWNEGERIPVMGAVVRHLLWSADGSWLAGVMEESGRPRIANEPAGSNLPGPSPSGNALPFAWLWSLDRSAEPLRIPDVAGTAIDFVAPDTLLVGHGDGLVRRWQITAGE